MANLGELTVKINSDTKGLEKGLKRTSTSLKNIGKTAAIGVGAVSAALGGVAVKSIKLAQEQEKAEARLESIAKKVTKATDEQVDSMKKLAAEYQKVTTFGDEVIISGQSQILSFGTTAEQTEMLTGSLTDLLAATKGTAATQEDAINAANMLGKAINGQAGALSRAGILMNEQQEELIKTGTQSERVAAIVDIMNDNYGGLAETLAQTSEGQMQQAKNAIGDIGEVVGNIFLPMINSALKVVQNNLPQIQSIAETVFGAVGNAIMTVQEFTQNYLIPIWEKAKKVATDVFESIKPIITDALDTAKDRAEVLWGFFQTSLLPVLEGLWGVVQEVFPIVKEIAVDTFETFLSVTNKLWTFFEENLLPILQRFFGFIDDNMPLIQSIVSTTFETIRGVMSTVFDLIDQSLLPVLNALFDFISGTLSTVGGIVKTTFDSVITTVNNVIDTFNAVKTAIQGAIDTLDKFFKKQSEKKFAPNVSNYGATSSTITGQNAFGGAVQAGKSYLVGERGAEVFTPSTSGTVSTGMGNVVINVNGAQDPNLIADQIVRILNTQGVR